MSDASARLAELVGAFGRLRVAVAGDFYLDEYIYGHAVGVSPEMPVLRIADDVTRHAAGAAGNVAANLAGLGAQVSAFGVVGEDRHGDLLLDELRRHRVAVADLVRDPARVTGTFTRIITRASDGAAHHQLRLDRDNRQPLPAATGDRLVASLASRLGELDGVFLADYDETRSGAGTLDAGLLARLVADAKRRGVVTAGSSRQKVAALAGVDYLFCNLAEARTLGLEPGDDLEAWAPAARRRHGVGCLCITLGDAGLFCSSGDQTLRVSALPTTVADTCGAGDSLAAAFLLAVLAGAPLREAAQIGTRAASIVIRTPGTVPVTSQELARTAQLPAARAAKLVLGDDLIRLLHEVRPAKKVVFTNGCFDIFHAGHLALLRNARACGDLLIVGINSDRSTRSNKGEGRPVLSEADRVQILAELECVDYVTVFDDLTPIRLIRAIAPDVLVKGGDYTVDEVVGKDIVEATGGKVVVVPYETRWTTRTLIQSVRAASDGTRPS